MANTLHVRSLSEVAASPWKNGGGQTRELICYPEGANLDQFMFRVSVADVAASGPFSRFPGIERIITLLNGAGMQLQDNAGGSHALIEALQPYRFAGETEIHAELAGGPSRDFNLMWRRQVCEASQTMHDAGFEFGNDGQVHLLFACRATWHLHDAGGLDLRLGPEQFVVVQDYPLRVSASPIDNASAALIHLQITLPKT